MDGRKESAKSLAGISYVRVYDHESVRNPDESILGQFKAWTERLKVSHQHRVANYGAIEWLGVYLPCIVWLRRYNVRVPFLPCASMPVVR